MGRVLYEAFFRTYTLKQWGTDATELPASILKRLPVRFDYNDNYYASSYQGIPREGYTAVVARMLDHPGITVHLQRRFDRSQVAGYDHVFCSGPIDSWFNHVEGRLGYRTLDFVREDHEGDYQGNAVINYCDASVPWTRISEHKHFAPWEDHATTVIFKEFSRACGAGDTPYLPHPPDRREGTPDALRGACPRRAGRDLCGAAGHLSLSGHACRDRRGARCSEALCGRHGYATHHASLFAGPALKQATPRPA